MVYRHYISSGLEDQFNTAFYIMKEMSESLQTISIATWDKVWKQASSLLMMIGCSDHVRTHEVCIIFNDQHPERNPISRSKVTKTLQRFGTTGMVKNLPKSG